MKNNNADQEYPFLLNIADVQDTKIITIKLQQKRYFKDEMSILIRMRNGEEISLQTSSKTSNLDLFIDENEVLCVGGKIKWSNVNTEHIHPILLSGKGIVTNLLSGIINQLAMVEEATLWTKLGHLGIGLWRWIQWFDLSLLDLLDADIYMERLKNRKWQIF